MTDAQNGSGYVIWGRRPVAEALEAGRDFNRIVVARGGTDPRIVAMARQRRVPVAEVDRAALDRIVREAGGGAHQGVAAYVSPISYVELDELARRACDAGEQLFVSVLDGIEDPQNLGSIIRTANAAGAHGVVIPSRRGSQVSPAVAAASAGAVAHTPVARVTNIERNRAAEAGRRLGGRHSSQCRSAPVRGGSDWPDSRSSGKRGQGDVAPGRKGV